MSIDWITVIAQIVNFLVLIWLLKRFLYRPILDGIDAREAEIADRMFAAAQAEEKAQNSEMEYLEQIATLKASETTLTDTARRKAEEARDVLLADAQDLFQKEREDWEARLEVEGRKYIGDLHKTGASALLELTRKALGDLAGETLEERIIGHVVTRLKPMAAELLIASEGSIKATATTHDVLPQAARDQLMSDLGEILPSVKVIFETDAKQSPGLVLRMGGAQVAWTVDSYIKGLDELLEEHVSASANKGNKLNG